MKKKLDSGMEIPDYAFESLARALLPVLQKYYDSDERQKALEEFNINQPRTK